ncbi:MAG: CHAT domain-containing protein, partial [Terriglobia bacterium]
ARLDFQLRRLNPARSEIENALSLFETSRATLASRELRTSYFASKHDYYELAVAILMKLSQLHPREGYATQALTMAERARSRTLLDALDRANAPSLAGVPPDLMAQERHVREELDAAHTRLRDELGAKPDSASSVKQLHAQIEHLLNQSDGVEARMRAASSSYAALARGEPVKVSDLEQRVVAAHSALLEYWVGEKESFLWIVQQHKVSSAMLPPQKKLRALVSQYRRNLLARAQYRSGEGFAKRSQRVAAADARLKAEALKLGDLLLSPVLKMPGVQSLYIVPDGPLWSLPFPALRIRTSTHGRSKQSAYTIPVRKHGGSDASRQPRAGATEYAIARFGMVEEPSASVLLSLMRRRSKIESTPRVAIFADPVYTANDPRVSGHGQHGEGVENPAAITRWVTEAGMARLPRLAGSRQEALGIAALAGPGDAVLHMGFNAQPAIVRHTDWNRYTIAHFATHAMINAAHPAFSGIVLTMVNRHGVPEDGVLWLNQIYSLRMPVSLVVLSGCRTAAGRDIPGEGIAGLSRAFFFAGASRVMGSLWSVEDRETPVLMEGFYRKLLVRRLAAAASLRAAQIQMTTTKNWGAPYFWAGFVLEGLPN